MALFSRAPQDPFGRYRSLFAETSGFFTAEAMACWDFLLTAQRDMRVAGNVLEIGVYQGKSALLAACHMAEGETLLLNDINPIETVAERVRGLGGPAVAVVQAKSSDLAARPDMAAFHGTARWVHIDGDHSGVNTLGDLVTAERFLGEKGIICVDDFFSTRYPQVAAMVFRFLEQRAPVYRMILCGAGKAYLCRGDDVVLYEGLIRKYLAAHLKRRGVSVSLHRSTHGFDGGCFGIGPREADRDYIGLDSDPAEIPA